MGKILKTHSHSTNRRIHSMKYLFSLIVTLAPSAIWAVAPEQLPEPSTLALFGAAALAVGFVSMKKRRK